MKKFALLVIFQVRRNSALVLFKIVMPKKHFPNPINQMLHRRKEGSSETSSLMNKMAPKALKSGNDDVSGNAKLWALHHQHPIWC